MDDLVNIFKKGMIELSLLSYLKRRSNMITYGDIYNEFCEKFPNVEVKDYRPAVEMYVPQLSSGIPYAIIVWLKDGSKVIYIAESEE